MSDSDSETLPHSTAIIKTQGKYKGDLKEMKVALDLMNRGFKFACNASGKAMEKLRSPLFDELEKGISRPYDLATPVKTQGLGVLKRSFINKGDKGAKYTEKQFRDIVEYGEKQIERQGVTSEKLEEITPFRRSSSKPATLSDPKYFISRFEAETGENFLPLNWAKLSEAEKVDYIVKDRYSKMVSHKIMGKIKNENVEHMHALNQEGDLIYYKRGNKFYCDSPEIKGAITIHNHPGYMKTVYSPEEVEYLKKHHPELIEGITPFSDSDILESITYAEKAAYVIDSQGHKFLFQPGKKLIGNNEKEHILNWVEVKFDLKGIADKAEFSKMNQEIQKSNELLRILEEYEKKKNKFFGLSYSKSKFNKLFDQYLIQKAKAFSMKTLKDINQALIDLSKTYGYRYEQLS